MPAPLVIAGIAAASALVTTVAAQLGSEAARAFLKRQLSRHSEEIEQWALSNVFETMGLPNLMEGGLNKQSFTQAVNASFLSGSDFQFTNLFDSQAIRGDAMKFGLMQAAAQAGLQLENVSIKGMSDALKKWVMDLIEQEISADEMGELLQDAADVYEIVQLYRKYKAAEKEGEAAESEGRKPLINTPEAQANRERQARYRASHRRVWVEK